jgi:hypothetical protein
MLDDLDFIQGAVIIILAVEIAFCDSAADA